MKHYTIYIKYNVFCLKRNEQFEEATVKLTRIEKLVLTRVS